MSAPVAALIWCPFGSQPEAEAVARQLVEERLVACANIVPGVVSVFRYDGEAQTADEVGAIFKTEAAQLDRAIVRLEELHPYDTPAICGWLADNAPAATRNWLAAEVGGGGAK